MAIDPNRRPVRMDDDDFGDEKPTKKPSSFNMNSIITIVVAVVLSLVLVYLFMFNGVDGKIQTATTDITKQMAQLRTDTDADVTGKLTKALATVPASSDVSKALADSADAKTIANGVKVDVQKAQQDILKAQDTANGANITANQAATKSELQTVQKSIPTVPSLDGINKNISDLQTSVNTLKEEVDKLKNPPTTTPTTTPTTGSLTVQIVPNIFGNSVLNYTQILQTGSASACTMQLINNTGKVANNIQLIVAFQLMNSTNTAVQNLPNGVTASLTMNGYFGIWTQQTGGDPSQLVFTNGTSTSTIFSSLYNLSQAVGTQNYTLVLTLKASGSDITNINFNVLPIVKIVSSN